MQKPKLLLKESYFAMIKNSEGTRMFRDFWGKIGGKKENLTKDGQRSCAFFVSAILRHFNLIKRPHLTVNGTLNDMKKSSWLEIKKPRKGSVILWEKKRGHYHFGFYLGDRKAVSNNREKRVPKIHHFTFNRKRKIEKIFWHRKLK